MATSAFHVSHTVAAQAQRKTSATLLLASSQHAMRFSIVLVLVWIGAMKFTAYEAGAIQGLIASSPLMSWLYEAGSVQGISNLIGVIEIATAIALAVGAWNRNAAIIGSSAAIATFTLTLTFLLSAPGWEASLGGFPALSVVPGQFLLKDIVLLASSVWLLALALAEPNQPSSEQ